MTNAQRITRPIDVQLEDEMDEDDDTEFTASCRHPPNRGGQHVPCGCAGVRAFSPKAGIGVTVACERSMQANKSRAAKLLRQLLWVEGVRPRPA